MGSSFAERLWGRLSADDPTPDDIAALDAKLVASAEQGLAPATLVARIAAANGADPYSTVAASLAVDRPDTDEMDIVGAIARVAGWIAHAIEEYNDPTPFRFESVYVGPRPPDRHPTRRELDAVWAYLEKIDRRRTTS